MKNERERNGMKNPEIDLALWHPGEKTLTETISVPLQTITYNIIDSSCVMFSQGCNLLWELTKSSFVYSLGESLSSALFRSSCHNLDEKIV